MNADQKITVRPITLSDIKYIVNYWLRSDHDYLKNMGVDLPKLPKENQLVDMLTMQIDKPIQDKKSFALICSENEIPIGHCNIVDIDFGDNANMHLHLWKPNFRQKGIGTMMVRKSVKQFFELFDLQQIISEPYSLNPAPHKVLLNVGFKRVKEYITTPGSLSFRQTVVRYELTRAQFESKYNN